MGKWEYIFLVAFGFILKFFETRRKHRQDSPFSLDLSITVEGSDDGQSP